MNISVTPLNWMADISSASDVMRAYVRPTMFTLVGLATLIATFFLVWAGIHYITSSGRPEKLEQSKRVMKNALIGLVLVIGAATLVTILTQSYGSSGNTALQNIPQLSTIEVQPQKAGVVDVLIKAIVGLFQNIVDTAAKPFIKALDYFTHATPLMAENPSVFKLWLTVVVIADSLFVVAVGLLGFHVMSAASLGLDEIEFKHMLPQLIITFVLLNSSIFLIDAVISLSNVMIKAIDAAFSSISVWDVLSKVASGSDGLGLVALLIMVVFLILTVILLVYYIMRLVTLYVGAILSPVIILLSVLPGFKDFASTAMKAYFTTVFTLFVQVIIIHLAASLFSLTLGKEPNTGPSTLMAMLVGIATLVTLLKTQGVMMQMGYVSAGPRALRKLGGQFMTGVNHTTNSIKSVRKVGSTK
jgi:hypothetical protein